ncbi:MAG TPA: class I SAM-dependent methyltransferase [Flavitalea sp.]|nr:class I SAM-dependent methyltransferase [Flavitalea sp.]HTF28288.1 class I SAM-dependent methyltransferase [Flavitalea sp.]
MTNNLGNHIIEAEVERVNETEPAQVNEIRAARAFSEQSAVFDKIYGNDPIVSYKRTRVREHIMQYLGAGDQILELNCGTGEDSLYFAGKGFRVHATDISDGMLAALNEKKELHVAGQSVTVENCSYTSLDHLKNKGPFDYIFSNFGGLNCTGDLKKVLLSFADLLRPGGHVSLVIISGFCLWETLLLFKGKFKTAFRRFFSSGGRQAQVEGQSFTCWYYKPSYVIDSLKGDFDCIEVEGLCTLVPPSYMEGFSQKYPDAFTYLCKQENKRKASFPWKYIGDYFIITLKKREQTL